MYVTREIEKVISRVSSDFPVVIVTGPRQVGKTTVLKNCDKNRKYVSLDRIKDRELAVNDPQLFLQKYRPPVFIDEVQYAPNLLSEIKFEVDQKQENGMYWLTGSQQFHLMNNVTESLAGRAAILQMQGFSQKERFKSECKNVFIDTDEVLNQDPINISVMDLYKIIWEGSFPKLICSEHKDWDIYYSSYIQSYIERDVRSLEGISDELVFFKFMRILAARTGQLLNCSDISNEVGVSASTIKKWISVLRASRLIYVLEPYYKNLSNRMTKMPKVYFLDTGLACYLTDWHTPKMLEEGVMSGAMFETYVVSEILKSYWFQGKRAPLFFYRDKDKKEIDLLIETGGGKLIPVEIKKKTNPDKKDIKNFNVIDYEKGFVVCLTPDYSFVNEKVKSISVGYL